MTTARIIGTSFGNGILQAKDKFKENRDGSVQIQRTFRALAVNWIAGCPGRGTPHPDFPTALLMERSAEQSSIPFLADVTLFYEIPKNNAFSAVGPGQQLPPDEYSETANSVEVPIEAHPNFSQFGTAANGAIFNADGKFTGWTKDSPYVGYLTYKVPSVTETVTKYYWSKPASVTTLIGSRQNSNWLVITGSTVRRWPYWAQSVSRIWSATPWNSIIYPN